MDKQRRLVVLSILGTVLDKAKPTKRWLKWRPNLALCQQPGLAVDRVELIHSTHNSGLADEIAEDAAQASPATEIRRHVLEMSDPWDFQEVYTALRDFAENYRFDTDAEDYLVNITTGSHVAQICWFLLAEARIVPASLLQLSPPRTPPADGSYAGTHRIIDLDLSKYDAIATRFARERDEAAALLKSGIATRNPAFNRMVGEIESVAARSSAPMLLTGPTGAGKSMLARRVYELRKARRAVSGGFVEVNCATLRGDHAIAALFGHVKGAYTGASSDRKGLLRAADGGILFLDEIGELGLDEQAMCLRAIEEKRFLPVGSDREASSDFQLIAGTNRDLAAEVRAGRFREDLLARIGLWAFELPPLRERLEDVEPNLDYELARFLAREGRKATMNREARERYLAFATGPEASWDANFRDLSASVTRMATLAPDARIDVQTVDRETARLRRAWQQAGEEGGGPHEIDGLLGEGAASGMDRFDAVQLAEVIRTCRRHVSASAAGRELFAASRRKKSSGNDADRLRKYLARFGLSFADVAGQASGAQRPGAAASTGVMSRSSRPLS